MCAVLAALVAAIYLQLRSHDFINYDDPVYVSNNPDVLGGLTLAGLRWAFTSIHAAYWHPVTWLSHQLDVSLFGRDAGAHLLVNVLLHLLNVILLFLWLRLATGAFWRSGVVAALFAVHPLHVESVAWISERKDVLSTLFLLLTLHAYTRFVRTGSRGQFIWSVVACGLGLMAKPMLVTLPFALLLLDRWPLQRKESWRALVVEKLPYLALVVPAVIMVLRTQSVAMSSAMTVPFSIRLANAAISYVKYVLKTLWPSSLAIVYPYPTSVSSTEAIVCALLLIALTVAAVRVSRRMPWITLGWLWFIGTLVPVIGIVQVGQQAMADRFTYIPHIGLFVAIVWTIAAFTERVPDSRYIVSGAAAAAVLVLATVAWRQAGYWRNSTTTFEHALAVTENNRIAHMNLGAALLDAGEFARAEAELRAAGGLPSEVQHVDLALALSAEGKYDEAAPEAAAAVRANPASADAWMASGTIALQRKRAAEAIPMLEKAAQLRPAPEPFGMLSFGRGQLLESRGDDGGAAREYETALKHNPSLYDARMNYGALLSRAGKDAEAADQFTAAASLRPQSAEPHIYLALAQSNRKQFAGAAEHIARAITIDHDGSNRFLIDAIHIAPGPTAVDEYLQFLRQQAGIR
jgi:tetratricopeptide (TPR) repeat protein